MILPKQVLGKLILENTDSVSDSFQELLIMHIKMLFEYRFLIYFFKSFRDNLDTNPAYEIGSHAQNLLKTHKFKATIGQRLMLYTALTNIF